MSYNKRMSKVKVINAKVNKNLINDELTFHPISTGTTGGDKKKKKGSKKPSKLDQILNRLTIIESTLQEHTAIFKRNNLK